MMGTQVRIRMKSEKKKKKKGVSRFSPLPKKSGDRKSL